MGRRSFFPRIPQDAYSTPAEAVVPLLPHLEPGSRFFEPCAGEGRLIEHLVALGTFASADVIFPPTQGRGATSRSRAESSS